MGQKLLQRQQSELNRWILATRINEQAFCCDCMQIALGRLGWGEKRLAELEQVFTEVYLEYDALRQSDGKDDRDCVYFQACIDRELKSYTGSKFKPYDQRRGLESPTKGKSRRK